MLWKIHKLIRISTQTAGFWGVSTEEFRQNPFPFFDCRAVCCWSGYDWSRYYWLHVLRKVLCQTPRNRNVIFYNWRRNVFWMQAITFSSRHKLNCRWLGLWSRNRLNFFDMILLLLAARVGYWSGWWGSFLTIIVEVWRGSGGSIDMLGFIQIE